VTGLAGLRLVVEPEEGIGPRERAVLQGLGPPTSSSAPDERVFKLVLEHRSAIAELQEPSAGPARVTWTGERLLLQHAAFEAVIDAAGRAALVRRQCDDPTGLVTTLRTVLSALLPLEGGVVMHAAALERRGKAFLFFGPSGIGKSTLAERSPWRVLADELSVVLPRCGGAPRRVSSAAFPAPQPIARAPLPEPPLACLVELAQGPCFQLERLDRVTALRRLLGSIVVPPAPPLWSAALKVAADLVGETPCYRMAWSLAASPFEPLEAALEDVGDPSTTRT
jgi:hypothetical protein